jgi:mannose-6-phosphate isomerase-like protein (cupin superfamily)
MKIVNRSSANTIRTRHGSVITPLIDRTTSEVTQCSLAEEHLPPGHAVTPHFHRATEEIYYVVDGSGEMTVGDETVPVTIGDAVFIPRNARHSLKNTGTVPMRIVLVCGPAFSPSDENFLDD